MVRWALLVGGIAIGTPAWAGSCEADVLAEGVVADELDAVQRVARTAEAFEAGCRGFGPALEAAGDISVVSPERRRALDFALGAKEDRWEELCPAGAKALRDFARVSPHEGRGLWWDTCELDGKLPGVTRDEWVDRLDGMLILPLVAAVILDEAGVDEAITAGVVRGLAGLGPDRSEVAESDTGEPAVADTGPEPEVPDLDAVLDGVVPAPAPAPVVPAPVVPAPAPVVPAPVVPAPAPVVPAPVVPDPVPVVPAPVVPPKPKPAKPATPAKRPLPPPPLVRATFKDGGQARAKWSDEALATGGTCVVRVRVGANGKMQRVTFLECPDALKADVQVAAERSKYVPANDGEYPVVGVFRTKWVVEQ